MTTHDEPPGARLCGRNAGLIEERAPRRLELRKAQT